MMKKFLLSTTALVLSFGAAVAADLGGPRPGSVKDEPGFVVSGYNWTGVYVGVQTGLMTGNTQDNPDLKFEDVPNGFGKTDFDISGATYGAHLGYNYQIGHTVLGIEGSYDFANVQGNTTCVLLLECHRKLDNIGNVVGKLGYARDRAMVYALGGLAWADADTKVSLAGINVASGSDTHMGWVAGLGFGYAISNNIVMSIEYRHMDLGGGDHTLNVAQFNEEVGRLNKNIGNDVDLTTDTIRLGVSLKFGGGDQL